MPWLAITTTWRVPRVARVTEPPGVPKHGVMLMPTTPVPMQSTRSRLRVHPLQKAYNLQPLPVKLTRAVSASPFWKVTVPFLVHDSGTLAQHHMMNTWRPLMKFSLRFIRVNRDSFPTRYVLSVN